MGLATYRGFLSARRPSFEESQNFVGMAMIIVLQVARSLWRQLRAVRREDDERRDAAFDRVAEARDDGGIARRAFAAVNVDHDGHVARLENRGNLRVALKEPVHGMAVGAPVRAELQQHVFAFAFRRRERVRDLLLAVRLRIVNGQAVLRGVSSFRGGAIGWEERNQDYGEGAGEEKAKLCSHKVVPSSVVR